MSYQSEMNFEVVTVVEVGAYGARVRTGYNAEMSIRWETGLPSPVPMVGESWLVSKVRNGMWVFESRLSSAGYNFMRYAMRLDVRSCVGRERAAVDMIAGSGVGEVYLTVAGDGVVYWPSEMAEIYGLEIYSDDSDPVGQVIDRCVSVGMSVVLVLPCSLWNDTSNPVHNRFQQKEMNPSSMGVGWSSVAELYLWGGQGGLTSLSWGDVRASRWNSVNSVYRPQWSFLSAKGPVARLVEEMYRRYGQKVRGVCFDQWSIAGRFADVGEATGAEYFRRSGKNLEQGVLAGAYSVGSWEDRYGVLGFFGELQAEFVEQVKGKCLGWQVSAIAPSSTISPSATVTGRIDTWIDSSFGGFGWSMVGCKMDFAKTPEVVDCEKSFEYCVAAMRRMARGCAPLYELDVDGIIGGYDGMFSALARYGATNILLDGFDKWAGFDESRRLMLKGALNRYSVTERSELLDIGVVVSDATRDISFSSDSENRFNRSLGEFCTRLLKRVPYRLRILTDEDVKSLDSVSGLSALVLFDARNLSDEAIAEVEGVIDSGRFGVVLVGLVGEASESSSAIRQDYPLIGRFGAVGHGERAYTGSLSVAPGFLGMGGRVYAIYDGAEGVYPVRLSGESIASSTSGGDEVEAPFYINGKSVMMAVTVIGGNDVLMELAVDSVMHAIGRE